MARQQNNKPFLKTISDIEKEINILKKRNTLKNINKIEELKRDIQVLKNF